VPRGLNSELGNTLFDNGLVTVSCFLVSEHLCEVGWQVAVVAVVEIYCW
jgi:hypothetical protein